MAYTVLFNVGSRDPEIMTDGHGFVEHFDLFEDANNEALDWLDEDQYRTFVVVAECDHERNHLI